MTPVSKLEEVDIFLIWVINNSTFKQLNSVFSLELYNLLVSKGYECYLTFIQNSNPTFRRQSPFFGVGGNVPPAQAQATSCSPLSDWAGEDPQGWGS